MGIQISLFSKFALAARSGDCLLVALGTLGSCWLLATAGIGFGISATRRRLIVIEDSLVIIGIASEGLRVFTDVRRVENGRVVESRGHANPDLGLVPMRALRTDHSFC